MENLDISWELLYNDIDRNLQINLVPSDDTTTDHYIIGKWNGTAYVQVDLIPYPEVRANIEYVAGKYSLKRVTTDPAVDLPWAPGKDITIDDIVTVFGNIFSLGDSYSYVSNDMADYRLYIFPEQQWQNVEDPLKIIGNKQEVTPGTDGSFVFHIRPRTATRVWIPYVQFNRVYYYMGTDKQVDLSTLRASER